MGPLAAAATPPPGLTESEGASRLATEGPNELAPDRPRGLLRTALDVLREPVLLLAAGEVYLLLGDRREALVLLFLVAVVITITLVQERKTERALAALRDLSSPRALVVRDGIRRRFPGREVVRGDALVLAEGDRVPSDAALSRRPASRPTNRSSPASRSRCASAPPRGSPRRPAPAVTTSPSSTPVPWW